MKSILVMTDSHSGIIPEAVMELWKEGLKEYEKILYIPMSSGLSGSCNTAKMLSEEPEFEGKVFVADNGRVSTPLHRSILDAFEMVEEGYSAEEIKEMQAFFPGVEILSDKLSLGLSCHTGVGALGIGCSCRPTRKSNI